MPAPARLGKYEIRREVGRGAIGVVYEGFDPTIGRTVAIKVLQHASSSSAALAEARLRFQREAQAAGRLNHPNIVAVFEYGDDAGSSTDSAVTPFIAMEFVKGQDLKALADAKTRFDLPAIQSVMQQLLAALQHAHEHGVVHRDIKPSNVILCDGNRVKVADFGIARLEDSNLTQTGVVMGTVSHMSPEQLTGSSIDRRTDIYSSGVILYELLTGEPPFIGSATTIMQKILNQEPLPPSTLNPALPAGLDAVVKRAMAKSPAARFATAAEFSRALGAAINAEADAASAVPAPAAGVIRPNGRSSRTGLIAGASILIAGVAGYAGFSLWRPPPATSAVPASAAVPSAPVVAQAPAASPVTPAAAPTPAPAPAPAPNPGPTPLDMERTAWDDAMKADSVASYAVYLKRYPKGQFARAARARIDKLTEPARVAEAPQAPVPPPQAPAPAPRAAPPTTPVTSARTEAAASRPERSKAASAARTEAVDLRKTVPPPAPAPAPAPSQAPPPAPAPPTAKDAMASASNKEPGRRATTVPDCETRALAGDKACQVSLAARYRDGQGVAQDLAEALRWYRKAADQGSDVAQFQLSLMYGEGRGVGRDPREAARWTAKSAEQGYAPAQNRLGWCYERGEGTVTNQVLASDWYRKAADQGLALAQTNLARMYRSGRGVFRDADKAVTLFRQAAAQGDANAAYHLGNMHEKGDGMRANADEAARWYRKALAQRELRLTPDERDRITAFVAQHP